MRRRLQFYMLNISFQIHLSSINEACVKPFPFLTTFLSNIFPGQVPLGANGSAYFPFEELCDKPLGAADYFGLFKSFHTLALDGVPIFGLHNRAAAYRFVTLVDVMYENKARLMCTTEGTPLQLFVRIVMIFDAKHL